MSYSEGRWMTVSVLYTAVILCGTQWLLQEDPQWMNGAHRALGRVAASGGGEHRFEYFTFFLLRDYGEVSTPWVRKKGIARTTSQGSKFGEINISISDPNSPFTKTSLKRKSWELRALWHLLPRRGPGMQIVHNKYWFFPASIKCKINVKWRSWKYFLLR